MQTRLFGRRDLNKNFVTVILLATLGFAGCGEKKEVYKDGHRDATPNSQQTETGGSEGGVEVKRGSPVANSELPPPGGPVDFITPGATSPNTPSTDTAALAPDVKPAAILTDDNGRTYTGSAADGVSKYLKSVVIKGEQGAQAKQLRVQNILAARSIQSASYSRSQKKGTVSLMLQLVEGDRTKLLSFSGTASTKNFSSLVVNAEPERYSASLKCLDAGESCDNALLKLAITSVPGSKPSTVYAIFRSGVADLYFTLPGKRSENPEFAVIRNFALDSLNEKETPTRVETSLITTYEIIDGRSGFEVFIKTADDQILGFTGPLVLASKGQPLQVPVKLQPLPEYKSTMLETIGSANLVANNGNGTIEIEATMREKAGFTKDSFRIRFSQDLNKLVAPSAALLK